MLAVPTVCLASGDEHDPSQPKIFLRGDIYYANLEPHLGSEQGGIRPVVVVQNNTANCYSPNLIVAPVTSNTVKKPDHQAHVLVDGNRAFLQPSMILAKSVQTISKGRLIRPMGRLSIPELIRLNYALLYQLDLNEWVWRKEAYERYSLYGECVEMNGKKKTLNRSLQTYMDGTGMGLNFDNSDRRPLTPQFPIKSGKHK